MTAFALRIESVTIVSEGLRLTWNGRPGRRYEVRRSEDLRSWDRSALSAASWRIDPGFSPEAGAVFYQVVEH